MKWVIYLVLLLGVAVLPKEAADVGKLIPVEVVALSEENGIITVNTDTGDMGEGAELETALDDMEDTAPGIIYLDTAEYLILEEGLEEEIGVLKNYLKPDVRVCHGAQGIALEGIASYLSIHRPKVRLKEMSSITKLQAIKEEDGRYYIAEK